MTSRDLVKNVMSQARQVIGGAQVSYRHASSSVVSPSNVHGTQRIPMRAATTDEDGCTGKELGYRRCITLDFECPDGTIAPPYIWSVPCCHEREGECLYNDCDYESVYYDCDTHEWIGTGGSIQWDSPCNTVGCKKPKPAQQVPVPMPVPLPGRLPGRP